MKKRSLLALLMALILTIVPLSVAASEADMTPEMLQVLKEFIVENYVDEITIEELKGDTPKEVFEHLDIHSQYYDPQTFQYFLDRLVGEYAGIGAYIVEVEGRKVLTPMEGSPSWEAGIQAGDEIITVDGKDILGMTLSEVIDWIKGPAGTEVTLGILREGNGEVIQITITRGYITTKTVYHEIVDDVGYLSILEFNENAYRDTGKALNEFHKAGIDKIIIDLRDNPGGLLREVVAIAKLLVPKGPILHVNYRNITVSYMSSLARPIFNNVVVLVNENSASASEILAAAIQDSRAGIVVGKTTYGKGSVQSIYYAPGGGGFKLTEARYLSPNGTVIDGVGVKPNYEVIDRLQLDFAFAYLKRLDDKTVNE